MRRLVLVFDVSELTDDEIGNLAFEASVQAETSDTHPGVPEPRVIIDPVDSEHARGFEAGYSAAIHDAGVEGSRAHYEIHREDS